MESHLYWSALDAAQAGFADPFTGSIDDAVDSTATLLADAVRSRMVADVPLGAFLSGGVDSSTVVALMQAGSSARTKTFSIGYADARYDESAQARAVAEHLGTDHIELVLEPADSLALIPDLATIYDEPFADSSQIPTVLVSRLARRHVTVALSGDGGDEVFAGYNRHVAAGGLLSRLAALPRPARAALARTMTALPPDRWESLLRVIPGRVRPRLLGEKLHKMGGLLNLDEREQYRRMVSQWPEPEMVAIGGRERAGPLDQSGLRGRFPDAVAWMRYLDLVTYLPGDILTKVDRASMSTSLEVRAPLLDHRLIEFSFRVPSAVHLHQGRSKYLLRRVLERYVPRSLIDRPKMGFGVPLGDWLRGPLREWAEDLLSEDCLNQQGLVRPEPVRAVWQRHLAGEINAQYQLWAVLMLAAWRQSLPVVTAASRRLAAA
jgi:asparagine synthase (glutamine-hydrolysing)